MNHILEATSSPMPTTLSSILWIALGVNLVGGTPSTEAGAPILNFNRAPANTVPSLLLQKFLTSPTGLQRLDLLRL